MGPYSMGSRQWAALPFLIPSLLFVDLGGETAQGRHELDFWRRVWSLVQALELEFGILTGPSTTFFFVSFIRSFGVTLHLRLPHLSQGLGPAP